MGPTALPPPDPESPFGQPVADGAPRGGRRADPRAPRYGLRRAVVAAGLVALVVGVAVGVVAVTSDGDGGEDGRSSAPGWRGVIAIDPRDAEAVFIDGDGNVDDDPIELGLEEPANRFVSSDTLIVGGDGEAAVVDLASGDVRSVELPEGAQLRRLRNTRQLVVAAADPNGGPAVVITADGEVDVNATAEVDGGRYLPDQMTSDPAGEAVLASEVTTFQTVLVPLDGDDPEFFAGAGVALTADDVVTLERVGPDAEVVITPRDGGDERRIATRDLQGVAATSDGGLLLVTEDGRVSTVADGADEAENAAEIDLADGASVENVLPFPAIDRALVADGTRVHLLDATDGSVLESLEGELALGGRYGDPVQRCQAVVTAAGLGTLDLVTGEVSAGALEGFDRPAGTSVDGCTVLGVGAVTALLHAGEVVELGEGTNVWAIAPDGSAVVAQRPGGDPELRSLDDPEQDGVPLDVPVGSGFEFVEE